MERRSTPPVRVIRPCSSFSRKGKQQGVTHEDQAVALRLLVVVVDETVAKLAQTLTHTHEPCASVQQMCQYQLVSQRTSAPARLFNNINGIFISI